MAEEKIKRIRGVGRLGGMSIIAIILSIILVGAIVWNILNIAYGWVEILPFAKNAHQLLKITNLIS